MATSLPISNPFKLHIAIDFGTDGIGVAYAIDNKVYVHQDFNSQKFGSSVKPKTIVLLDNDGDVNSFGIDAQFMLSIISINAYILYIFIILFMFYLHCDRYGGLKKKDKWLLFERFKMSLYGMCLLHSCMLCL